MNENTMSALEHWMAPSWWPSNDEDKFYLFVFAAWQEFGTLWDETATLKIMLKKAEELQSDYNEKGRTELIEMYHSRATVILDFLAHIKSEGKSLMINRRKKKPQ